MRCEEFLQSLDAVNSNSLPEPARGHLAQCPSCATAWSDWQLLRAGLRAIACDAPPEAQFGFASRVLRRLDEARDSGRAATLLFEHIGRRFVLGGLVLVALMILGMVLPASSPIRVAAMDEPYLAQTEPSPRGDLSPFGYESPDSAATSNNGGNQAHK